MGSLLAWLKQASNCNILLYRFCFKILISSIILMIMVQKTSEFRFNAKLYPVYKIEIDEHCNSTFIQHTVSCRTFLLDIFNDSNLHQIVTADCPSSRGQNT